MHPHRVEVLHAANGNTVVCAVTHHLELDLLPAQYALLQHHLADAADLQANGRDLAQLLLGVGNAASGAAKGVGRTDDHRVTGAAGGGHRILHTGHDDASRHRFTDLQHGCLEQFPVLGPPDRLQRCAQHLHPILIEHTGLGQFHRQVQASLATQA